MSELMPRIWVLLGHRHGDNNQLLALAEALGTPFETRTLGYRRFWAVILSLFPASPRLLDARSRSQIAPPWPDLVIGIGRRSVPVARWIKRQSGGRTKLVRLGNPRADPRHFDLVLTTPQYPVPPAPNVLALPLALARNRSAPPATPDEVSLLAALPRPHLLLSLGGATRYWHFPTRRLSEVAVQLAARARAAGGSLIVVGSPRTPAESIEAIRAALDGQQNCRLVEPGEARFAVLLNDADENFVTADSVSMLSEAVLAGKPVGMIPVELDAEGRRKLGMRGGSRSTRDIRRFWTHLEEHGLVGTIEQPARGHVEDPVALAAAAVGRLLGDRVE